MIQLIILFINLKRTKAQESWISQDIWRLADICTAVQRAERSRSTEVRQARREFHRYLKADRWKQAQSAGDPIEASMEADTFREAWTKISRCYSQARGAQTPPTLEDIKEVTMERAELYMCRPPEGLKVPLLVRNTDIKDGIPMEA